MIKAGDLATQPSPDAINLFAAHMFACKSGRWLKPFEGRLCFFLRISLDAIYLFQDLASSG